MPRQNEPCLRRLLQSMSRTATTSSRLLVQPGQLDSVGTHLLHSVGPAPISEARSVSTRTASPGCPPSAAAPPRGPPPPFTPPPPPPLPPPPPPPPRPPTSPPA